MSNEKDLMGYDPLEWLKEESSEGAAPAPVEPEETSEPGAAVAEPVESGAEPQEVVAEETDEEAPAAAAATGGDDGVLDLQNSLQIMDVALLKPRLEQSLAELKMITLRADEDIAVDGAGIQLLLTFVQQARRDGVGLQWEALPPPIVEAARLLNAEQILLAG